VARLIQQSLAQDRMRNALRNKEAPPEQSWLQTLEDQFHPKDEVMEHHLRDHQHQQQQVTVALYTHILTPAVILVTLLKLTFSLFYIGQDNFLHGSLFLFFFISLIFCWVY
jgi:hypothetical protein